MSACVELWHHQRQQMFLMNLLEGSFTLPLMRFNPYSTALKRAPSSHNQYLAVYVEMRAAELEDLIKASDQHTATATHRTVLQSCFKAESDAY